MKLSPHFTLQEFLVSTTASQLGIKNKPTREVVNELNRLADTMEYIRHILFHAPILITSGYRCPELNTAVGGATNSSHLYGRACDFIVPDFGTPAEVCYALEPYVEDLEIDQLLLEYGDWIHLGRAEVGEEPRCECLTIDNSGTTVGFT